MTKTPGSVGTGAGAGAGGGVSVSSGGDVVVAVPSGGGTSEGRGLQNSLGVRVTVAVLNAVLVTIFPRVAVLVTVIVSRGKQDSNDGTPPVPVMTSAIALS